LKPYAIAFTCTTVVFLALDFVWLGFVAKDFYRTQIGPLMLEKPLLGVASAFYVLYTIGIVYFAVMPALETGSLVRATMNGALLGLIAYATYDLTNLATLRGWSAKLSMIDLAWGILVTSVAASAGYFGTRSFSGLTTKIL
jgi:uncharacterized membrane protein